MGVLGTVPVRVGYDAINKKQNGLLDTPATKAGAVDEGNFRRTVGGKTVETSYSHPKLIQQLVEYRFPEE